MDGGGGAGGHVISGTGGRIMEERYGERKNKEEDTTRRDVEGQREKRKGGMTVRRWRKWEAKGVGGTGRTIG